MSLLELFCDADDFCLMATQWQESQQLFGEKFYSLSRESHNLIAVRFTRTLLLVANVELISDVGYRYRNVSVKQNETKNGQKSATKVRLPYQGWVVTIWLMHILTQHTRRMDCVQDWANDHKYVLRKLTKQKMTALDFTDDRLALCLRYLDQRG